MGGDRGRRRSKLHLGRQGTRDEDGRPTRGHPRRQWLHGHAQHRAGRAHGRRGCDDVASTHTALHRARGPEPGQAGRIHHVTSRPAKAAGATPRERLLAAALEHFGAHGIGDTSLRGIAEALGTSHRMLIYHFGSREGLLAEVTSEVEARQRALMTATYDTDLPPLEAVARY